MGSALIMDDARQGDIEPATWGAATTWLFAMAAVVGRREGGLLTEYVPSTMGLTESAITETHAGERILRMYDDEDIDRDDINAAYAVLSRFADMATANGRGY